MIQLLDIVLGDELAERVRRNVRDVLVEIQASFGFRLRPLLGIRLEDGKSTPVAHKLGREYQTFTHSPVRDAVSNGRIEEICDGSHRRDQYIVVKAVGYGATITLDLWVS